MDHTNFELNQQNRPANTHCRKNKSGFSTKEAWTSYKFPPVILDLRNRDYTIIAIKTQKGTEKQTPPIAAVVWTKWQQGGYQSELSNNPTSRSHYITKGIQQQPNEGQRCDAAATPRTEDRMQLAEAEIRAGDQIRQTTCIPTASKENDQLLKQELELLQTNFSDQQGRHQINNDHRNSNEKAAEERRNLQRTTEERDHSPPNSELLRSQSVMTPAQQSNKVKNPKETPNSQIGIGATLHRDTELPHHNDSQADYHLLRQEFGLLQSKYKASEERQRLIDEDNKQKSILYTKALEQIHQLTEENQRLQTKSDAAEGHRHQIATTQKANQNLRQQVETLQTQHPAELERNKREQQELRKQLEKYQGQHEAALAQNRQICAENDHFQQQTALLQKQHAVALEESHKICAILQEDKCHLQAECEHLQVNHRASK